MRDATFAIALLLSRLLLWAFLILPLHLPPHKAMCIIAGIGRCLVATNLAINDDLLVLAQKVGGLKTKKETVNAALKEFVQRRKQEGITELFGTLEHDSAYDYKNLRKRK
jgi:Arc/MetJ family transcription regulator